MSLTRPLVAALLAACLLAPPAEALSRVPTYWNGQAEGARVAWNETDLAFFAPGATQPFYSFRKKFLAAPYSSKGCEHDGTVKLVSLVGPIATLHESDAGYCEGAAHPFAVQAFRAMDLRKKGQPAKLTDWFPKADIYKALMADTVIQKALQDQSDAPPKTLDSLLAGLRGYISVDCAFGIEQDLLERFAFHHIKGNQVAVRLGLSHGCEANRGGLTQLGIYLPIPAALKTPLKQANAGRSGFLMNMAPRSETTLKRP